MISHKHKCIFVEVPKTGSTSIRAIIGSPPTPHLDICQISYNLQHYWTHYGGIKNRIFSSLYILLPERKRIEIGKKQFNSYFKFGFVRNPWDRFVSLYLRKEGLKMKDKMTFDEFVEWIKYSSGTCVYAIPHMNQLDWFVDPHGNVLVDSIGKFENIQTDWGIIAAKLGLPKELPHENKNPDKKHYTEYYSKKTKEIIKNKFRVDIEHFQYRFGD